MARKQFSIRDQHACGSNTRGKRWLARVWDAEAGKHKSKAFEEKEDARRWAKGVERGIIRGEVTAQKPTLATVGGDYLVSRAARGCCALHIADTKRHIESAVASGIADLTARNVATKAEKWAAGLTARNHKGTNPPLASASSRRRALGTLISIGKWAVRQESYGLNRNPFAGCELPDVRLEGREVYSLAELRRLVDDQHANHPWHLFAVIAAYTGMRSREIQQLRWSWIKWDAELIGVPASVAKTKRSRWVPLQPELAAILKPMAGVGEAQVFPMQWHKRASQQATRGMQDYLQAVGIKRTGRIVHDLRHSAAGLLTATGMSSHLVMDYLGHTDTAVSKHYSDAAAQYLAQVKGWPAGKLCLRATPRGNTASA